MTQTLPETVRDSYRIDEAARVGLLGEGSVNRTLLVEDPAGRTVLQQMPERFGDAATIDMAKITDHLAQHAWHVPRVLPAVNGRLSIRDETGAIWRQSTYVPCDGAPKRLSVKATRVAGRLLAQFHDNLRTLQHDITPQTPDIHDRQLQAARLEETKFDFEYPAAYTAAEQLLSLNRQYGEPEDDDEELILHGDPKLANWLYRGGRPFTLVDFDCVQTGSALIDCGDGLRSIFGTMLVDGRLSESDASLYGEAFTNGYNEGGERQLKKTAVVRAAGLAAVNLGIRYLNDIDAHQPYFVVTRPDKMERPVVVQHKAAINMAIAETALRQVA